MNLMFTIMKTVHCILHYPFACALSKRQDLNCAVPKSRHATEIHQPIPYTPYKHELVCSVSYLPPLTLTFVPVHSLPSKLRLST